MTKEFLQALCAALWFETGGLFDPTDPACINGTDRRKCGTSGGSNDRGGNTKYGIAANAHPGVDIDSLNLRQAAEIYWKGYWLGGSCDKLPAPIGQYVFDISCGSGIMVAIKILQKAVGVTQDGVIGSNTLQSVWGWPNDSAILEAMRLELHDFYEAIARRDLSQAKFVPGWERRADTFMKIVDTYKAKANVLIAQFGPL